MMALFRMVREWRKADKITEVEWIAFLDAWTTLYEDTKLNCRE